MNNIRPAELADLEAIVEIYNQAVKNRFETADTVEVNPTERIAWFTDHQSNTYPIFVYEKDNKIAGWLSVSPYRQGRKAMRYTVEISYYVHNDYKRQGIGSRLLEHVIDKCKELKHKTLFAIILDKNVASTKLLTKFGFEKWGHLPDVADFDGIECGHVYYGLRIGHAPALPGCEK